MPETVFQVGDRVRVRHARRRDVTFLVTEVAPHVLVAVNERGGEARYSAGAFELVEDSAAAVNEEHRSPQQAPVPPPYENDLTGARKAAVPAVFGDGATVVPFAGETIDSLVRRFKKATQKAGILSDLHRHEYYEKPSVRRKVKSAKARARRAKLEAA